MKSAMKAMKTMKFIEISDLHGLTARPAHRYLFSCRDMVSFTRLCFAALRAALATGEDPSLSDESSMLQSAAREYKLPSSS